MGGLPGARAVLEGFEGPEVEGVGSTLEKSAKEAAEKGEFTRAAQLYRQLVDTQKDDARYLLGFAENTRKAGQIDQSLVTYEAILKLEPDNIEAKEGMALALLDKGEFEKSGDYFADVMEKNQTRWRTLNGLGILFVTHRMFDEAMAYFTEALAHSKNNASVLNNIGLTLAIQNHYDDAAAALQKASDYVPASSYLRRHIDMNLAMVYGAAGNLNKAKAVAAKHLSGPSLDNNMGFYAHLAKDDQLAKSYLNMALTKSPRFYERAWRNLDEIEQRSSDGFAKGKKSAAR